MIKLFLTAAAAVLLFACYPVSGPYISMVQPNYSQDSTGQVFDRYITSTGTVFVDTQNKYHTWDHYSK